MPDALRDRESIAGIVKAVPALISIAMLLIFLSSGCVSQTPAVAFPEHLMVNYTAVTMGELFPCGCRIPLGGLSRRAGVMHEESPYPQLKLDAGSFARGNTVYDRFIAGWILRAYAEIDYTAINLGTKESVQPVSVIREWDSLAGGILISANLLDSQGLPVTRTSLIREIGGIKIGITGMTAEVNRPVGATEMPEIVLPVPALEEVMEEFDRENVDFVVLLADASSEEIGAILGRIPGIDLVIQAQEFNASQTQTIQLLEGGTRLVRIGGFGKYLGRLRLDFEPDGSVVNEEIMLVHLDSTTPTLASITELLTRFRIELRGRREEFIGDPSNPFQRAQSHELIDVLSGYTGEAFCAGCHVGKNLEPQYLWHQRAWTILNMGEGEDADHRSDPNCLPCHTTGYDLQTGLDDPYRDSHLQGIRCEACHGPAAEHVREQTIIKEGMDASTLLPYVDPTGIPFSREVPEEVCLRCHTEEWTPDFDYETWIERVRHPERSDRPRIINPDTGEVVIPDLPEEFELPSED